jgi:C4-dicarboxylate transporter, DctM subunit
VSITLLLVFMGLAALGVPLAIGLGLSSVAAIVLFSSTPVSVLSESMFSAMNSCWLAS